MERFLRAPPWVRSGSEREESTGASIRGDEGEEAVPSVGAGRESRGRRQVVSLGAGSDSRFWRLMVSPSVVNAVVLCDACSALPALCALLFSSRPVLVA